MQVGVQIVFLSGVNQEKKKVQDMLIYSGRNQPI
jgi:hypothetical protein